MKAPPHSVTPFTKRGSEVHIRIDQLFTAPMVIPSIKYFLIDKESTKIGTIISIPAAAICSHMIPTSESSDIRPTVRVTASRRVTIRAKMNSFQDWIKQKAKDVITPGIMSGRLMCRIIW